MIMSRDQVIRQVSDKTEVHLLQQLQSESKAQSILYGRAVGTCHHILSLRPAAYLHFLFLLKYSHIIKMWSFFFSFSF